MVYDSDIHREGFNELNYPRATGSSDKGKYRLDAYLGKSEKEVERYESSLWSYVDQTLKSKDPIRNFEGLEYLRSGLEFSVFKLADGNVVKIPSGVFAEVSTRAYLVENRKNYEKVLRYFPREFVPETKFKLTKDGLPVITQPFITSDGTLKLKPEELDEQAKSNFREFFNFSLTMLREEEWLPFVDFKLKGGMYKSVNILLDTSDGLPKIIDFSNYWDSFRLYPKKTEEEVATMSATLEGVLEKLS